MSYVMQFLTGQQWALLPSTLEVMRDIAQRHPLGGGELDSVMKREGIPVANTRSVVNRDGVAVIPVVGVISRYASFFTDVCGGATVERLATDIAAAIDDPSIRAVVLDIDSPGGQVTGINELADQLYNARGKKPLIAYGGGAMASGAFWLASACDEIVVDDTSQVGSVGVVATYRIIKDDDQTQTIELVSNRSPNKRPDITSADGKAKALESIDAMADVFIGRVARNLGMSEDAVVVAGDSGGVLIGQHAVNAGLAHRLGSLEGLIAELSGRTTTGGHVKAAHQTTAVKTAAKTNQEVSSMVLTVEKGASATAVAEALKAQHPDAFNAIVDQGREEASTGHAEAIDAARKEGATAETARVKAVFDQTMPGHEALVQTLALDGETSGEQAAVKVLAAERAAGAGYLETAASTAANNVEEVADSQGGKTKVNSKSVAAEAQALVDEAAASGRRLSMSAAVRQLTGAAK